MAHWTREQSLPFGLLVFLLPLSAEEERQRIERERKKQEEEEKERLAKEKAKYYEDAQLHDKGMFVFLCFLGI